MADAFEETVRPHLGFIYGLAVRLCGNRTAAEDLLQDGLLRAFRAFPGLRNPERLRLWLTRVLTSAFHDRVRSWDKDALSLEGDTEFDLFDRITEEDLFPYSDRVHLDFLDLFDDARLLDVLQVLHPDLRLSRVSIAAGAQTDVRKVVDPELLIGESGTAVVMTRSGATVLNAEQVLLMQVGSAYQIQNRAAGQVSVLVQSLSPRE